MEESSSMEIQLATASINNEDQNTQKEANILGGNENKNAELVIEIRNMFQRPEIRSSECRIYKVPHNLRKLNEEAYTPQVISIGPFHHKNERLKAMEEHKERYFKSFVERSDQINLENLVFLIREMEESIRGCYEETINLNSDRFVKMILVDASFILELFFRHMLGNNPLIEEPRFVAVMLDLVLLENQLPFFVIEKLYHLAFPFLSNANPSLSKDHGLLELSFRYFSEFNTRFMKAHPSVRIEHFTDLLRTFQIPPPKMQPKRCYEIPRLLYTATQLYEAGVKFKVSASESSFDIKFGLLEIPSFELSDRLEVVYRNIIALEQTRYIEEAYFTEYFILMDLLIKTRKDVDLLCHERILVNKLGDNNAANSMINNLGKGIILITAREDYIDLWNNLNSFYEKPLHIWKAVLTRNFFSTPSATASTVISLVIITLLTFIQTVCSIIQVKSSI